MNNVLPDSRAKETRDRVFINGAAWIPVFCANCGKEGGRCPEENMTFMFYLCNGCFERYGHITHTYIMPDEVFYQKLRDEQLEKYGRFLTPAEIAAELENPKSGISLLAKEAPG